MATFFKMLLKKFFNAFLWALLQKLSERLGMSAEVISALVNQAEAKLDLTGIEKAELVAKQIKELALSKGKDAALSDIRFAIETAVKVVRGGI